MKELKVVLALTLCLLAGCRGLVERKEIQLTPEPTVREIKLGDPLTEKLKELGSYSLRGGSVVMLIIPINIFWVTLFDRELPKAGETGGLVVGLLRADKLDASSLFHVPTKGGVYNLHVYAPLEDDERRLDLLVIESPQGPLAGFDNVPGEFVGANARGMFTRAGSVVTYHTPEKGRWVPRGVLCGSPDPISRGLIDLSPETSPEVRAHGALQRELLAAAAEPRTYAATASYFEELARIATLQLPETKVLHAALADVCEVQGERWASELASLSTAEVEAAVARIGTFSSRAAQQIAAAHSQPLRDELAAAAAEPRTFAATKELLGRVAALLARNLPDGPELRAATAKVLDAHADAWVGELAPLAVPELSPALATIEKHSVPLADRVAVAHVKQRLGLDARPLDAAGVAALLDRLGAVLGELKTWSGLDRARKALAHDLAASVLEAAEKSEPGSGTRSALAAVGADLGGPAPVRAIEKGGALIRFAVSLDVAKPSEVRDANGYALALANAPLTGSGDPWSFAAFRYFVHTDEARALVWPHLLAADGAVVARPDDLLGIRPLSVPGQGDRAAAWFVVWRTVGGDLGALVHGSAPGEDLLRTRSVAVWLDAALDTLHAEDPRLNEQLLVLLQSPGHREWEVYSAANSNQAPYTRERARDLDGAHAIVARINAPRDQLRKATSERLAREQAAREEQARRAQAAALAQKLANEAHSKIHARVKTGDVAGARQVAIAEQTHLGGQKLAIRAYVRYALDANLGGMVTYDDLYAAGDGADSGLCRRCSDQIVANSNRDAAANSGGYSGGGYSGGGYSGGGSSGYTPAASGPAPQGAWDAARDKKIDDTIRKYSR